MYYTKYLRVSTQCGGIIRRYCASSKQFPLAIHRTLHAATTAIQHVGVNHRGLDVLVTQRFLDSANIVTRRKQVSGETVPEGMATAGLYYLRLVHRLPHGAL